MTGTAADQATDIIFLVKAGHESLTPALWGCFFVVMPLLFLSLKQLWQGRGVLAVLRALTGTELLHQLWIAVRSSGEDKCLEWTGLMQIFVLESVFEGLPLVVLALVFVVERNGLPCQLVTCSLEAYQSQFPGWTPIPEASPSAMTLAYSTAIQTHGCPYLPLTSDGWFSMGVQDRLERDGTNYTLQDTWLSNAAGGWLAPLNFTGASLSMC
jgi:hypothetical protein